MRIPDRLPAAALLLILVGCGVWSASRMSATFDETAHLPAGITYLDRWDFRHNPEHPPLAKAWAALPLWFSGAARPDYGSPHWIGSHVPPGDPRRSRADQWKFGFELLNGGIGDPVRRDPSRLLFPARVAMLVPAILLCLLVQAWAGELWGRRGGLLALGLCALAPATLAHGSLVTTDLSAALGFAAALFAFRRFTKAPGAGRAILAGAALGGALLVKYSTLLLGPILAVLAVVWAVFGDGAAGSRGRRAGAAAAGLLAAFATAFVVLWAGYGFRFSAVSDPGYRLEWESVEPDDPASRAILAARDLRVLPEAYLFGLAYARGGAARRLAFLDGEESLVGWWRYFPEAFLLKTPLAFLGLLLWSAASGIRRARGRSLEGWTLALPVAFYLAVSMAGNLNIGHRHLMPVYPLLFVAAGRAASFFEGPRGRAVAAWALVAGCAASFAWTTPRYLSYFNALGGGNRGGWRHLVDSNVDWGQDLPALRSWVDRNGGPTVHLAYFGTGDPKAYGIPYRKVKLVHDFRPAEPSSRPSSGDLLAVSVTLLQGVYLDGEREFAEEAVRQGRAGAARVREWLALRDASAREGRRVPGIADWMVASRVLTEAERREIERPLLSTWMRRVRDTLEPIGRAGDSIRIYRMP